MQKGARKPPLQTTPSRMLLEQIREQDDDQNDDEQAAQSVIHDASLEAVY